MSIFNAMDDHGGRIDSLYEKLIYIARVNAAQMSYIYGAGVSVVDPYGEMMYVKKIYGQEYGKAYFHYVFKPEKDEEIDVETFYELGIYMSEYIALYLGHYQVEMSLHFDTDMHMHFIANNIDIDTGKRMNLGRKELCGLKISLTEIVRRYNISPIRLHYPVYILD